MKTRNRSQQGFTLIELMVVVSILAILAAIAVPMLTKDDIKARYDKFISTFLQDVQRAHMAAIASRQDRWIVVESGTAYQLEIYDKPTGLTTFIARREAPPDVWIAAVTAEADTPWSPKPDPSNVAWASDAELRFRGVGSFRVKIAAGAVEDFPATVYFGAAGDRYKTRVVLFPATSFAKRYDGW